MSSQFRDLSLSRRHTKNEKRKIRALSDLKSALDAKKGVRQFTPAECQALQDEFSLAWAQNEVRSHDKKYASAKKARTVQVRNVPDKHYRRFTQSA